MLEGRTCSHMLTATFITITLCCKRFFFFQDVEGVRWMSKAPAGWSLSHLWRIIRGPWLPSVIDCSPQTEGLRPGIQSRHPPLNIQIHALQDRKLKQHIYATPTVEKFKFCHVYQRAVIKNKTFYIHSSENSLSDGGWHEFKQAW